MARARRLEIWTLAWMISVIAVVGLAMGSSQAMKTAWIEDVLSLVPAAVFLIASRFECKPPNRRFPFGYHRVNSLAFLIAAVALAAFGALLLVGAVKTLILQERVTIGLTTLFGQQLWAGWLMIAALLYSVIPPVILGRMKLPLAERLQDKVLHTDAMMNKADWMTGLAAILGIVGLGFGLWWADAVAAAVISLDVLHDGIKALRTATAELVDGAPRALDKDEVAADAQLLQAELERRFPDATVRLRETGRYIRALVDGDGPAQDASLDTFWPGDEARAWRLLEVSFRPEGARRQDC